MHQHTRQFTATVTHTLSDVITTAVAPKKHHAPKLANMRPGGMAAFPNTPSKPSVPRSRAHTRTVRTHAQYTRELSTNQSIRQSPGRFLEHSLTKHTPARRHGRITGCAAAKRRRPHENPICKRTARQRSMPVDKALGKKCDLLHENPICKRIAKNAHNPKCYKSRKAR